MSARANWVVEVTHPDDDAASETLWGPFTEAVAKRRSAMVERELDKVPDNQFIATAWPLSKWRASVPADLRRAARDEADAGTGW